MHQETDADRWGKCISEKITYGNNMEIPTPAELREKRIRMGLKQADVARMAGISQSMVARIESGSVDPRVSTLAKIVEVLQAAERSAITAADVMTSPVLFVVPGDPISRAVEIMGQNGISQLPVLENGVPVGCISESAIMNAMEEVGFHQTHQKLVRDCMEPGFPTVPRQRLSIRSSISCITTMQSSCSRKGRCEASLPNTT